MRVKMSKPPPPAPTASAIGPCPTVIKIVGRPGTGSLPSTIAPPDHPARQCEVDRTTLGTHKIKLTDEKPIKDPQRRVPLFKRDILDNEVKRLEKEGFIEKSDSPWSAQTVLVKKKDGSWRMFVDYRKFNDKMVKNVYPIPRIDDNLDALGGAKWSTTFDCNMAYNQVPLEEKDKKKTKKKNSICDSNERFVSIHIWSIQAKNLKSQ